MESIMTRFYLLVIFVAAYAFPSLALATQAPTSDEFVERTKVKLEKLLNLIRAHQDMENTFIDQQKHLMETYGDLDSTNVYQDIDLTTMDGIRKARERLKNLNARTEKFAVAQKQSRTTWEHRAKTADVDEPLRGELKTYFSTVEPTIAAKYAAWFEAMRDTSAAIARLLDTAQRYLGKLEWHDGQLIATDKRASIDLLAAQKTLADADHRETVTGRAALHSHDPSQQLMQAAMDEIGYTIHHRNDN
jgi:hypothetical protein